MEVLILGSSSATPIYDRHPSSQLLTVSDVLYLIDCGEGTLFRINEFGIRKNKIKAIFISHLHGDHYYGLMGLLTTMSMQERVDEITIVSPFGLKDIVELQCQISKTIIRFPIHYVEFSDKEGKVYEDNCVEVSTIPLDHKITTCGFLFNKKFPERKIQKDKINEYDLTNEEIARIVKGEFVYRGDSKIDIESISSINVESKRYAYCSDTRYSESYVQKLKDIDLLYHESTFLEKDKARAVDTKHSTAMEAAMIAHKSGAKKLIIGHFSARYLELQPLLDEAKTIFDNTNLALEGKTFQV